MATRQTTVVREVQDLPEVDPIVSGVKSYLQEGGFLPEGIETFEFRIKVQQLDRRGKAIQGVAHQTDKLDDIFNEVLDELGPGRFTVWCNFRKSGSSEKWRLIKVEDVQIQDPGDPGPTSGTAIAGAPLPPGREDREDRRDVLQVMLTQMQETTKMMIAQQTQTTQLFVALLSGKKDDRSSDLLEAIRLGSDLAARRGSETEHEDEEPLDKLIRFGGEVIELLKGSPGETIPVDTVKRIASDAGIDQSMIDQGFEHVQP